MFIKNVGQLISHGNTTGRQLALEILEAGLDAADTYKAVRGLVRIEDNRLLVGGCPELDVSGYGDLVIDLDDIKDIYVLGAGKAIQRQAKALEDILGDRLTAGAITIKKGEEICLERIEVTEGAHPVPDETSMAGARKVVEIAQRAGEGDLVFTLFSDGASSLFPLPAEGFDLDDVMAVYRLTIKHGPQTIIHRIMKYFSAVNCGRVMEMIHPARTINTIMQVGRFERWCGSVPTEGSWIHSWPPPERSYEQDVRSMQAEPWWDDVPEAMREALERLDPRYDVPRVADFGRMDHSYWQPVDARLMVEAAQKKAEELGIHGAILAHFLLLQSDQISRAMTNIARQVAEYGEPFEPPVALITSGELMVPVGDNDGIGGRNQEFALTAATMIGDRVGKDIVVAAVDSDGTDGPGTQYTDGPDGFVCQAGGVVDGHTWEAGKKAGLDILSELRGHNSSIPLWKLSDAIITGNTGTAVGDLRVALVLDRASQE